MITLAERFGRDQFTLEEYDAMIRHIAEIIAPFEERYQVGRTIRTGGVQMIGTSGTVTTLAGVDMDLPRYDRARVDGTALAFDRVSHVSRELASLDLKGRAAHPALAATEPIWWLAAARFSRRCAGPGRSAR